MSSPFTYPIANDRELKQRYITLLMCEKGFSTIVDDLDNISLELKNTRKNLIIDIKHSIRNYHKRCNNEPYHTRCIYGEYDEYLELIEVNEPVNNIDKWFNDNIWLSYIPSLYDCTGQHFTLWYKPVFRHGKWFIYHKVGVDV